MSYELAIGDRSYSSWSLRGWLLFEKFGLPVRVRPARLYTEGFPALLAEFPPARTAPAVRTPEGAVIWDSLAIAEELATRHPEARMWPSDPALRALARSLAAEMHSSFQALRTTCPMNLRTSYADFAAGDEVRADVGRIETIWRHAFSLSGGPWLCGAYSVADAFFAPVSARVATYGLPVGPEAGAYVARHLADPAFRRWRAQGSAEGPDQPFYRRDNATRPWPGPVPLRARAVAEGSPENAACPYSGRPVTHLLELDGRIFGFCNAACRDKTVADPEVWPDFMALLG